MKSVHLASFSLYRSRLPFLIAVALSSIPSAELSFASPICCCFGVRREFWGSSVVDAVVVTISELMREEGTGTAKVLNCGC
ncbi:hypothetical protein L195_g058833, partial [Trifolium pratense]